ncbi:MAG TPA: hypothetical protein VN616_00635 [Puia sp.]|nr:hypothetical protein [Puia sp.]
MKKIYLLTTGICLSATLWAQSPGGISTGLSLWLKADAAPTLNLTGSNVNSWTYFNNGANSFSFTGGTQAAVVPNAINGLPTVSFGGNTEMDGPTGASAPLAAGSVAYSVFAVWNSSSAGVGGNTQRIWGQWGGQGDGNGGNGTTLWLFQGNWGDQPEISPFTTGEGRTYPANGYMISQMNLLNQNTSDLQLIDQNNLSGAATVLSTDPSNNATTTRAFLSTAVNSLGYRANGGSPSEFFSGNLAELIVYTNPVDNTSPSSNARNQIFSYLAMKYGIPTGTSLLSSTGAVVWDAAGNATYNNSVIALGVDNGSGLNVQSTNVAGAAGVSGAGNLLLSAYDPLVTNGLFIAVGNDNGSLTESTSNIPVAAAGSSRLQRNWFVQNTGPAGRVNVGFDFTGVPITGAIGTTSDFRLMVNSAGNTSFPDATTELYTPSSFTGNVANFTAVTLSNGSVFAIISNASGATPLPVNFISFTAQGNGSDVDLNWSVGDNEQASNYEIDRSADGAHFEKIAVVPNVAGQTDYGYVDATAGTGTHYYRVLETDLNGQSIYSKVVSATLGEGEFSINVLNNPAQGRTEAELQINAVSAGKAFVELWSVGGARISLLEQALGTGPNTISVPMTGLQAGTYVIKVTVGTVTKVVQLVKL